ncbi:hypothetical protein BKA69DRAFT_1081443 [Paraphysoderma sedebokerense]|nr:hypothetical protein BKA69DRAFT_1081443 [Paraphysoderma sedebokerense]
MDDISDFINDFTDDDSNVDGGAATIKVTPNGNISNNENTIRQSKPKSNPSSNSNSNSTSQASSNTNSLRWSPDKLQRPPINDIGNGKSPSTSQWNSPAPSISKKGGGALKRTLLQLNQKVQDRNLDETSAINFSYGKNGNPQKDWKPILIKCSQASPLSTPITSLHFCNNELKSLPEEIDRFHELEYLDVSFNKIRDFPKGMFGHLKTLKKLDCRSNLIEEVTNDLGQCLELRSLLLFKNEITQLNVNVFSSLKNLVVLDLSYNKLHSVPAGIFSSFKKLVNLSLAGNKLSALPSDATCLASLQNLDLSDNSFTAFPSQTSSLTSLQRLDLSQNAISIIPSNSLLNLTVLSELYLQHNRLNAIPEDVSKLVRLIVLDIRKNQLKQGPGMPNMIKGGEMLMDDTFNAAYQRNVEVTVA